MTRRSAEQLDDLRHRASRKSLGFDDLSEKVARSAGDDWEVLEAGGGILLTAKSPAHGPIELHVVPHGGTVIPDAWSRENDEASAEAIVDLAFANYDAGTPSVAARLVAERPAADRRIAVAVFHVSRLFLDANRLDSTGQVPANPYIGSNDLYRRFLLKAGSRLRETMLLPWVRAVNALIEGGKVSVVYHHHSFERFSRGTRVYDTRPGTERPPAQLFWAKPSIAQHAVDSNGLAPRAVLDAAVDWISKSLGAQGGVKIDDPLLAPAMPFHGCVSTDDGPYDEVWHFVYELRKDLLVQEGGLSRWLEVLDYVRAAVWGSRDG